MRAVSMLSLVIDSILFVSRLVGVDSMNLGALDGCRNL